MKKRIIVLFLGLCMLSVTACKPEKNEVPTQEVEADAPETVTVEKELEFVNRKGDIIQVYQMTDGTIQDTEGKRFAFDGVDTWTDEDGVEWNETVE